MQKYGGFLTFSIAISLKVLAILPLVSFFVSFQLVKVDIIPRFLARFGIFD